MNSPSMPVVRIENRGPAQTNIPFTFGQVFAPGHLGTDDSLEGVLPDGTVLPLQVDRKATHANGSVRHVVITGMLPKADNGQVQPLALMVARARAPSKAVAAPLPVVEVRITQNDNATVYTARTHIAGVRERGEWLLGDQVGESTAEVPLLGAAGQRHPHLAVRVASRIYKDGRVRTHVVVENMRAFAPGHRNYDYRAEITVGTDTARIAVLHFHHARWRHIVWTGGPVPAQLIVHPDTAYLIAAKAIPHYDMTVKPTEKSLARWAAGFPVGPMQTGPVVPDMPRTGGRPDLGPLPAFSVAYLLTHDYRALNAMLAAAEGSASWPIHYRDDKSGQPLRSDDYPTLTTHMNMAHKGPLPVPRTAGGPAAAIPYQPDVAHQPSLVYLPYLLTGDLYYLEELHFWAAWNPLETDPANSGNGAGLLRFHQLRGQAWGLRTLGHAAYITPDGHPLKEYFTKQLDNNLAHYHRTFVEANPNALGLYDGTGERTFRLETGLSPWQDDFFTWSLGHLVELGFERAAPIFQWKAKFVVGRLTAPGYCWVHAADYHIRIRDTPTSPVYGSFAELYQKNYAGDTIPDDDRKAMVHPQGLRWIDQACGSKAQGDWIRATGRRWVDGQMFGYAGSSTGYPSNMQPALAMAVTLGAPGAAEAWKVFDARTVKPNYAESEGPQFAIVPRPVPVKVEETTGQAGDVSPRLRLEHAIYAHSISPEGKVSNAVGAAVEALADVLAAERALVKGGVK